MVTSSLKIYVILCVSCHYIDRFKDVFATTMIFFILTLTFYIFTLTLYILSQPSIDAAVRSCSWKICKIQRKTTVPESFFNKVERAVCSFIKKRLMQVLPCEFWKQFFVEHLWGTGSACTYIQKNSPTEMARRGTLEKHFFFSRVFRAGEWQLLPYLLKINNFFKTVMPYVTIHI